MIELEKEINDLEIQDNFDETSTLLHDKKLELMTIRENKVRGTILRSKVKWIEEGEKPTKYFCALESRNYVNKTVKFLELQNGALIYNQSEIMHKIKHFYSNLYASKEHDIDDVDLEEILHNDILKLSDEESFKLEGKIVEKEIYKVLKGMPNSSNSFGLT